MGAWSFASHTQALIHSNKLGLKTHKCILIIFLRRSEKSIRTVVTWIWITGVSLQFGLQEPSREFKVPLCSQLLRTLQEIVHFGLVISIWSLFFGWLPAQDCIQHVEGKVLGKLWDSPSCKSLKVSFFDTKLHLSIQDPGKCPYWYLLLCKNLTEVGNSRTTMNLLYTLYYSQKPSVENKHTVVFRRRSTDLELTVALYSVFDNDVAVPLGVLEREKKYHLAKKGIWKTK